MNTDNSDNRAEQSNPQPSQGHDSVLDRVSSPADLKGLDREELRQLCDELRAELIRTVSEVGGHFASSLGVVELSVAIHALFETPHDRLVWDVGHQAYIHKMLTGRRKDLPTVRTLGGISGFPKPSESPYDSFGVGHAGTSISAALGMLEASHHDYPESTNRRVVAVLGDGAITAGIALEALNHAGQLKRRLVVVLNDNAMSIAPNVGGLSRAFSKAMTNEVSTRIRRHVKRLVRQGTIPRSVYHALDRWEDATMGFFSAPAMIFESFGFRYIGPIDGHDIDQVVDALNRAKKQDGPVLVHALTVKGKGYEPAERDPVTFHGVGPFEIKGGKPKKNGNQNAPSYTEVFGDTLVELCEKDSRVVGITAAMPDGTGLTRLAKEMPERFFDVGIAEQHAVTFSAGLASEGMRPFCTIYSTFLQRAYDQVLHDVGIQSLPVIFAMDRAGLVGADGATHQGVFDIAFLRNIPHMTLMAPKDEAELRDMMLTAAHYTSGPIAIRYPRGQGSGVDISKPPKQLGIGKMEILRTAKRGFDRVAIFGLGQTVRFALRAADELSRRGIEPTVVNSRFVKPLDESTLEKLAAEHSLIVTVEDGMLQGGFGSAVLEFLSDVGLARDRTILRLGIDDFFVEQATQNEQYEMCGFDPHSIVARIQTALRPRGLYKHSAAVANA